MKKLFIPLVFILFMSLTNSAFSNEIFKKTQTYGRKADDIASAVKMVKLTLDALFPYDTYIFTEKYKINNKTIYTISAYYEEIKDTTIGDNLYFISFWEEDEKGRLFSIGSNTLNIHTPFVAVFGDLITIQSRKGYDYFNTYYYTFRYSQSNIYFHRITGMKIDADNNTAVKYYYLSDKNKVNIKTHSADYYIK